MMKKLIKEILIELREIEELLRIMTSNTEQNMDCSVMADKLYSALNKSDKTE